MKPLTPEEQLQMQIDLEHLKSVIMDLQNQNLLISESLHTTNQGLMAVNKTVTAHHELIKAIAEKMVK